MIGRVVTCLVLGAVWLSCACSSTATNESPGSGGGGGSSATACGDAGLGCIDCCKAEQGEIALSAFVDTVKLCSCTDIVEGCVAKCKPACTDQGIADPCMLCIRAGEMSQCMSENCKGDCAKFLGCVQGCGG